MEYLFKKTLPSHYVDDIWEILKETNMEFIPPLSVRASTIQNDLKPKNISATNEPVDYFNFLKNQSFVIAVEDKHVIGFLSYIQDYNKSVFNKVFDYVSTIAILKRYRNKGISIQLYQELFKHSNTGLILTRTWSTNYTHIKTLTALGFKLEKCIKNDRGEGIDTIYYQKQEEHKNG